MKNLFKTNKTNTNIINTTNSIQKGEIKMTNTKKTRKHGFKTRIIATALSAITLFSVGSVTMTTTASAAEKNTYVETALKTVGSKMFGYAQSKLLGYVGPELTKLGFAPILKMAFDYDMEGASNEDVIESVEKSTEEIKAEIGKVLDQVDALSDQTKEFHQLQMDQLKSINSNINTKGFRTQADKLASDFDHAIKRIDGQKDNITCDGSTKINNTTYKAYKEILSDPKCNISEMQSNFDDMIGYLKGQKTENNNEKGYKQLTDYVMDMVKASDKNLHSYTETPDYYAAIKSVESEIRTIQEHALLDYAIINALNSMAYRVKEYEVDNGLVTVNSDEKPYAKFEGTAKNMHNSLVDINTIFTDTLKENEETLKDKYVRAELKVYDGKNITKGCSSFIDAWSQGIDSGKGFEIKCTQRGEKVKANAKKGFKLDENVKGINSKGGFDIPANKKITIDMKGWSNGFDATAKNDTDIFTVGSGATFILQHASLEGGKDHILVPDGSETTCVSVKYSDMFSCCGASIHIAKNAKYTFLSLTQVEFWYACCKDIVSENKSTTRFDNEWVRFQKDGTYYNSYT